MFFDDHGFPHFHARHAEGEAKVRIDNLAARDTGRVPKENVEIVRRLFDAVNRRALVTMEALLPEEAEFHSGLRRQRRSRYFNPIEALEAAGREE